MKNLNIEQAIEEAKALGLTDDEAREQVLAFADGLEEVCDKCGGELEDPTADYCNKCWFGMEKEKTKEYRNL